MPRYSLDLIDPEIEPRYVPSHEFPDVMTPGDVFLFAGNPWQVTLVAAKPFDAPGEPRETLRCVPAKEIPL